MGRWFTKKPELSESMKMSGRRRSITYKHILVKKLKAYPLKKWFDLSHF